MTFAFFLPTADNINNPLTVFSNSKIVLLCSITLMKRLRMRYMFLAFAALFFASCDNELDLVADYKETPVVYGLVDQGEATQYIRVERAFVDKNTSALEIAQNPDSLYYEDITVKLVRVKNGEEYILERVDGNQIGYPREDGVFATAPNYLYKIDTEEIPLVVEETIELRLEGIFEDRAVTATADVLVAPFFVNPQEGALINFERNKKTNIGWNPKGDPTIYSAAYIFNVSETKDGNVTEKKIKWVIEANTDKTVVEIEGADFFAFMLGALEKDPTVRRTMGKASFELIAGNQTVADYIRVGQANLGITSSGEIPVFTNLSEGLGLFGSSFTQTRSELSLTQVTLDSLVMGSLTEELNFQQ